ncbi:hypothetical protein ACVWZ4_007164 [Bradyrhizobium sp. USDA 4472]
MAMFTTSTSPHFDERRVIAAYSVALVLVAVAALCFAAAGPGNNEATLALMTALP